MIEAEEEARLRAPTTPAASPKPRLKVTHRSSPEEIAAFRAAVQRENVTLEERIEARLTQVWTPREERFAQDLSRLWRDATWIQSLGQFPDGQPLQAQRAVEVEVWGVMLAAMQRRMWGGGKTDGKDEDE